MQDKGTRSLVHNIRNLVRAALLAAIAVVLMLPIFEIPMAFLAPWLKLDISSVPVLLAGFGLGPFWGLLVQAVKSIIHIPMGSTGGIGELADFLMGSALMLPAAILYTRKRNRSTALIGMSIGIIAMVAVGALTNYFILLPMYFGTDIAGGLSGALGGRSVGSYITLSVLPFNLIKGIAVTVVTFILYRFTRRLLHDNR